MGAGTGLPLNPPWHRPTRQIQPPKPPPMSGASPPFPLLTGLGCLLLLLPATLDSENHLHPVPWGFALPSFLYSDDMAPRFRLDPEPLDFLNEPLSFILDSWNPFPFILLHPLLSSLSLPDFAACLPLFPMLFPMLFPA